MSTVRLDRARLGISIAATCLACLIFSFRVFTQGADRADGKADRNDGKVDFEQQIRPIFEKHCYECHGPSKSRGHLRLHVRELALKGGVSGPVIVPGHSQDSVLVQRILGLGDDDRMPRKKAPLSDEQIALVQRWIDQGASWPASADSAAVSAVAAGSTSAEADDDTHWAYVKPKRPELPKVTRVDWVKNPIDAFVLARLEHERLEPSAGASRAQLLRRVTLDLTGLPPTLGELDAFMADTRPDAYERLVDRLLASPHFGERWARPWLDLARYADTNGYEKDRGRTAWAYRDWVIDALNADMPFDQFTIEQIAGDMLPNATPSQRIATGFHRNAMTNEEGGVDPEESLYNVLVDRVNTTGTVWLGTTIGCAQCHNHKYDPFSQKDYYRLLAFFQNTDYKSQAFGDGTRYFEGEMDLATPEQGKRRAEIEKEIARQEAALKVKSAALAAAQTQWENQIRQAQLVWKSLRPLKAEASGGVELTVQPDNSLLASGPNPEMTTYTVVASTPATRISAIRLEALPDQSLPRNGPGRDAYGQFLVTGFTAEVAPIGATGSGATAQPVSFTSVKVDDASAPIEPEPFFSRVTDTRARARTGWTIAAVNDTVRQPRQAVFTASQPFGFVKGSRLTIHIAHLGGTIGQGIGRFRLSVTGSRQPNRIVDIPVRMRAALALPPAQRSAKDAEDLTNQFRSQTPLLARTREALKDARMALVDLHIPTALVMREKSTFERPSTYVHERGAFTAKGALVYAGVPASLHRMPDSQPMNRLGLAHWLVDDNNPLVARVAVNRLWEQLFGRGIVETSEDFGTQGTPPSHPELLDWLATEFLAQHWSQKAMLRLMVTSATYRQDSRVTPALLEKDPYNRLLARGPRFRMEAEMIRDVVLSAAGLLSPKMHGPSVFPPQPEGIWNVPYSAEKWVTSKGEDRYRRSLYTYIRRTAPYPTMIALDATSREYCTVRRVRTNTPLQALALLNDEAYFEAAHALAHRLLTEPAAGETTQSRLTYGMRAVVSRNPTASEMKSLEALLDREMRYYGAHQSDAQKLVKGFPETPSTDPAGAGAGAPDGAGAGAGEAPNRAAWIVVSNVLLNLDELLTKE